MLALKNIVILVIGLIGLDFTMFSYRKVMAPAIKGFLADIRKQREDDRLARNEGRKAHSEFYWQMRTLLAIRLNIWYWFFVVAIAILMIIEAIAIGINVVELF